MIYKFKAINSKFLNICLETYKLDPTRFLTAPGLA